MTVPPSSGQDDFDEASRGVSPDREPVFSADASAPVAYAHLKTPADERKQHDAVTRRWLAAGIVGVILILDVFLTIAFVFWGFSKEDFSQAMANLAGPQALAAAVVGFYYGKSSHSSKDD